jgi:hypothetical protein
MLFNDIHRDLDNGHSLEADNHFLTVRAPVGHFVLVAGGIPQISNRSLRLIVITLENGSNGSS